MFARRRRPLQPAGERPPHPDHADRSWPPELRQPLGDEPRVQVDVDLAQPAGAGVDESVWLLGVNDRHLARIYDPLRLAVVVGGAAFDHDEYLHVGMAMQPWPFSRRHVDEDHARANATMLLTDELMRRSVGGQLVSLENGDRQYRRV